VRTDVAGETRGQLIAPPALEARQPGCPRVALVDEAPANTAAEVLVRTPYSKVDAPVVQVQLDIPHRVRQIEARDAVLALGAAGDGGDVERLPGAEAGVTEQHQGNVVARVEGRDDLGDEPAGLRRARHPDDSLVGREASPRS
jgi:hypothetical protein